MPATLTLFGLGIDNFSSPVYLRNLLGSEAGDLTTEGT
jgi:hypothetical protein